MDRLSARATWVPIVFVLAAAGGRGNPVEDPAVPNRAHAVPDHAESVPPPFTAVSGPPPTPAREARPGPGTIPQVYAGTLHAPAEEADLTEPDPSSGALSQ